MNAQGKTRKRAIEILENLLSGDGEDYPSEFIPTLATPPPDVSACQYLGDLGALTYRGGSWRPTAMAPSVWVALKSPRRAWLMRNWFPLGVLIITGLVGVGTIISNFVT